MNITLEELKKRIRDAEKEPLPEGLKIMCICGEIHDRTIMTDEEIEDMWRIVTDGES